VKIPRQILRDVVTIRDWTGSGSFGATFGSSYTRRVSVQPTTRVIIGPTGATLRCDVSILIRPEDGPIRPQSWIKLGSSSWRVLECSPVPTIQRPTHYEILAATWTGALPSGSGS